MSRRSSGPAVALFPFLAVLLCAMGALILLLLILTREIREDVQNAAHAAPVETPDQPESIPLVTVTLPPATLPPPTDPNVELRGQLAALTAENDDARREIERIERSVVDLTQEARAAEARVAASAFEIEAAQQRLSARQAGIREREAVRATLLDAIGRARGTLDAAVQSAAIAEPKVSILPYDGRSGTPRRPILIECTGRVIRFLPEGVELTASDVDSFLPDHNPLLAGVVALRRHWASVDGRNAPPAYVLLLVREDGVAAYYAARALLQSLDRDTGYELLTDDLKVKLPDVDLAAREACRAAVVEVLNGKRPSRGELASQKPLFPSGRFEVDPSEHDPTTRQSAPIDDRLPPGRLSGTRPPERTLADGGALPRRGLSNEHDRSSNHDSLPPGGTTMDPPETLSRGVSAVANEPPISGVPNSQPTALTAPQQEPLSPWSAMDRPSRFRSTSNDRATNHGGADGHDTLPEAYGIESKRRWGVNAPTANIALERPVSLRVTGDQIVVGSQTPIAIDAFGISLETVRDVFAAIDREAQSWGRAPGQFYWSPRLFATVQPGGTGHFDRLRRSLTRGGLRVSSEIVLAPEAPAFLELNHAETAP